jgi:hypothetical protein
VKDAVNGKKARAAMLDERAMIAEWFLNEF